MSSSPAPSDRDAHVAASLRCKHGYPVRADDPTVQECIDSDQAAASAACVGAEVDESAADRENRLNGDHSAASAACVGAEVDESAADRENRLNGDHSAASTDSQEINSRIAADTSAACARCNDSGAVASVDGEALDCPDCDGPEPAASPYSERST